ncbi:MAG: hypothetical protein IT565_01060 [Rhodospirillales bacterium]|nr:hypothetical protein [Rhodospirillales bacterium]
MTRIHVLGLAAFLLAGTMGPAPAAEDALTGDTYASLYVYLGDLHAPAAKDMIAARSSMIEKAVADESERQRQSWSDSHSRASFPDYGVGDAHETK